MELHDGVGTSAADIALETKMSTLSFGVRTNDPAVRSDFFLERNLKQLEFEEEITAHQIVISINRSIVGQFVLVPF